LNQKKYQDLCLIIAELKMNYCITAKEIYDQLLQKYPDEAYNLNTERIALIVFPTSTINYWKNNALLQDRNWLMDKYSLYASPSEIWTGKFGGISFTVVRPPMGDSSTGAVIEQLIVCGTEIILLICGAWGIQDFLEISDVCIPTISKAHNKISQTYCAEYELSLDRNVQNVLQEKTEQLGINFYSGKNVAFESFYRIKRNELIEEKSKGVLTAENGELHTLLSIAYEFKVKSGALFYNYFMPLRDDYLDIPSHLFKKGGETIGRIALESLLEL
jgi:purine-nucleoside phosphorylase